MKENFLGNRVVLEQKESQVLKEKLNLALVKLQEIINKFPNGSRERIRAEHTLHSVEGALLSLGKEGAPKNKYRVAVEGYPGNPHEPYIQHEGVPVDELIDILKNSAKELNKSLPTKASIEEMEKKVKDLDDEYKRAIEVTDKAVKYSKWEEAQKALYKAQELREIGHVEEAKNLEDLAAELYKNSQGYFEVHYTKKHGENADIWTEEEKNKQDLRTRHEAKLISLDYRTTGSEEGDYKAAMDVLKYRRELKFKDKRKTQPQQPSEPVPPVVPPVVPPTPEPVPPVVPPPEPPPEPPPVPPVVPPQPPEPEKMKKVTAVEAKALAEFLARERGAKLLNEKLNRNGWLKRKWTQMWEPAYRAMLIEEERKKIYGKENKPSWLRRKIFGANEIAETGKKNLMAGTGKEAESEQELKALVERFSEDYIRNAEGEQKKQLDDPELKTKINDLVHEYATGAMIDAKFEIRKDVLMEEVAKKYPDVIAHDGLTADNFLEAAKNFRLIYIHNKGLARTDVQLEIDLGVAKQAIKTKVNLNWVDKSMSWVQKHGGPALSPEAVGIGVSIGSYFSRKPLYWLGGAAGLGGLMGAMRKNVEQKHDLEMHRVERAMGDEINDFGPDAKRRQETEKFVYEMKKASDVINDVTTLATAFQANPDRASADALINALAETEARQNLSTMRERDLISFAGETTLERGRLELMRTLAEAKVSLQKGGFSPGDITSTAEYDGFVKSLGGEMDKIESSERWHRWGENAKAGAIGAVGGLVVGGLAQEGMALIGDHVSFLHWLRPGGKLTSLEKLYSHLHGTAPTGPTGAGMEQILGIAGSRGTIRIDGSTNVAYDKSTGLWTMFDKSGHGQILAKFNVDPTTGETHLIPGSYDPNLISLHETSHTASGGTKNLSDWIDSVKGSLGKNVVHDKWHLGGVGFLDNDTPSPTDTQYNELRLDPHYDASGNLKIDTSKLHEFLANASGKQIEGSAHAGKILEVAKAFSEGKIKIGLVPDTSHPTEVLQLTIDPVTKQYISADGSDITKFFMKGPKGLPILKGHSLLGMIHEIGARPDGSKNIEWVNAIRGNGEPIETGSVLQKQFDVDIVRKIPKEWWGLWAWNFRRKPLEEKKGEQGGFDTEEKKQQGEAIPFEGKKWKDKKIEYFEEPEDPGKKIKDKEITGTVVVDTRGQKIEMDRKDYEEGYPEKFTLKNEKKMAAFLLNRGGILMSTDYIEEFKKLNPADRATFLENQIKKERENLQVGDTKFTKEKMDALIDVVLKQVDKVLDKYGPKDGRSQLPAKERIHIVGLLEYQAQIESTENSTLGVCFSNSGEIFINFEALKAGVPNIKEFIPQLKRMIAHEVMHDAATNNYWMFQMEKDDEVAIPRRTGIKFIKRQAKEGKITNASDQVIVERGRALNEAITESLAEEITKEIYTSEGVEPPKFKVEPYSAERDIVKMLQKKFNIGFEDFAKAVINRRSLRGLAEKLDGFVIATEGKQAEHVRSKFMSLLMSVMDSEHNRHRFDYTITKKLIQGKKNIVISKEMKKVFPRGLLDENGNIKESIAEKYSLIDQEAEEKLPFAA